MINDKNTKNPNIKSLEEYFKLKYPVKDNYHINQNPNNLLIYVITFNMKGKTPTELDLTLLFPKEINKFDLYIISTQECLRSISASMINDSKEEWVLSLAEYLGKNYIKIIESNLNAIHICIFSKKEKAAHFHDLRSGEIKTGFLNIVGNKGAVSASLKYLDKNILFIGCHLAAGQDETNERYESLFRINNSLSISINKEAKQKLKLHRLDLTKTYKMTIPPRYYLDDKEINNNNINELTFGKNVTESQIKNNKSIKLNEDNEEDKKDEEPNFLKNIQEIKSEKDEEEKLNLNINDNNNNKIETFGKNQEHDIESISSVPSEENKDKKIDDYDFVILSGDLNYRLNFENKSEIEEIMNKKDPQILWDKDQLTKEIKEEYRLQEGIINFMPTYKYKENKNEYDYGRIPGWTDRILFRSKKGYDIMLCEYNSIEKIFLSDHKPVYAVFKINFKNKKNPEHNLNIKENGDKDCIVF